MDDKIMVVYVVNEFPEIARYQPLKELKAKIDTHIEKHGGDAIYDITIHDGWASECIEAVRLETDEYQKRIEQEQRIKQQAEEKERKEFERLKAKYGG